MPAPTFTAPGTHAPEGGKIAWVNETVAGTAGVGTLTEPVTIEPFKSIDFAPQRDTYDAAEYGGAMTDIVGQEELTHYEQLTVTVPLRASGLAAHALALLMGSQTYTPPVAAPGPHTLVPVPTSNLCNTITFWYQTAIDATQANWTQQYVRGTVTSWHITFGPTGDVNAEIGIWAQWPTFATSIPSTNVKWVGSDYPITQILGYQGLFTIFGNSGSAYTTSVISGDMTIQRALEPKTTADSQNVQDLKPGPITAMGSMVVEFQGYNNNTIADDFRGFKKGGTSANPQTLKWTDSTARFVQITSWPWKWQSFGLDRGGRYVKANVSWRAHNDPASVFNSTAPVLTAVKQIIIQNDRLDYLVF